jgi:hypothetical protein
LFPSCRVEILTGFAVVPQVRLTSQASVEEQKSQNALLSGGLVGFGMQDSAGKSATLVVATNFTDFEKNPPIDLATEKPLLYFYRRNFTRLQRAIFSVQSNWSMEAGTGDQTLPPG